ncbi:MAG: caspase family protein, partial [Deltaproteobacteria bacterium]|nr:caspase family protein [Deltaproteobacteria bacterium]
MSALLLVSALATAPIAHAEAPDEPNIRRYALLVGANDGGPYRVRLRYAHADARSMAGVLTDLGGVEPKDRVALYDPDVGQLSEALADLAARLREATEARKEVLFYYSGHSDETGLLLGEERYDYDDLRVSVGDLPADVRIAILDSCASGALVRRKGGRQVAPFLVDESRTVEGHAFITSSSADESAQEADRLSGSYFTHYLVTGLRGAADVSRDKRVTLHEAYQYAFDETLAQTSETVHGAQHANYDFQLAGAGDLVLTDLTRTSASLAFSEDLEGRAYVRDEEGHLVAELFKPSGRPIMLGLAEAPHHLRRGDDDLPVLDQLHPHPPELPVAGQRHHVAARGEAEHDRAPGGLEQLRDQVSFLVAHVGAPLQVFRER